MEQVARGLNTGAIDRDLARALQPIAARILEIAMEPDNAPQSQEVIPPRKRRDENKKLPAA
jgi:hypothetical protein